MCALGVFGDWTDFYNLPNLLVNDASPQDDVKDLKELVKSIERKLTDASPQDDIKDLRNSVKSIEEKLSAVISNNDRRVWENRGKYKIMTHDRP